MRTVRRGLGSSGPHSDAVNRLMTSAAKKILNEALSLPEDERRSVAERLLASVERESADAIERAWDDEVLDRIKAITRGESEARTWDQASAELRAKYAQR